MTPVRVMLEPTTGIARRIATTSTANVEKPSANATPQIFRLKVLESKPQLFRVCGLNRKLKAES